MKLQSLLEGFMTIKLKHSTPSYRFILLVSRRVRTLQRESNVLSLKQKKKKVDAWNLNEVRCDDFPYVQIDYWCIGASFFRRINFFKIRWIDAFFLNNEKENILSSKLENKWEFNENKVVYDLYFIITRLSFSGGRENMLSRHVFCHRFFFLPQSLFFLPASPLERPTE